MSDDAALERVIEWTEQHRLEHKTTSPGTNAAGAVQPFQAAAQPRVLTRIRVAQGKLRPQSRRGT